MSSQQIYNQNTKAANVIFTPIEFVIMMVAMAYDIYNVYTTNGTALSVLYTCVNLYYILRFVRSFALSDCVINATNTTTNNIVLALYYMLFLVCYIVSVGVFVYYDAGSFIDKYSKRWLDTF